MVRYVRYASLNEAPIFYESNSMGVSFAEMCFVWRISHLTSPAAQDPRRRQWRTIPAGMHEDGLQGETEGHSTAQLTGTSGVGVANKAIVRLTAWPLLMLHRRTD